MRVADERRGNVEAERTPVDHELGGGSGGEASGRTEVESPSGYDGAR
jgi:hypothetical protein